MRADAQENKRLILEAAIRLFAAKGEDVSLRAIAKEAGVGIATLLRHFPTIEDLYDGVRALCSERMVALCASYDREWEDPGQEFRNFVFSIRELQLGAIMTPLWAYFDQNFESVTELEQDPIFRKTYLAQKDLLARAADYGVIRKNISPTQFFVGITVITRPLPDVVEARIPGLGDSILDTFIRGLR
ncbi:MAG: helix-turn-helix domain-containing protein [Corynebacterium sp.]|nr:helix-turn-helix domain-containing protein [Corynebacterium sp.]